jgi:hypothetical protein
LGNEADANKNEKEKHGREGEVSSGVDDRYVPWANNKSDQLLQ